MVLVLLGMGGIKAEAQSSVKGIVIEMAGGKRTEYALTETPKLTYNDNTVTLITTKGSVEFTATDIVKVVLTDIRATSIDAVETEQRSFQLSNDEVRMSGLAADEIVKLYNVGGKLLSTWRAASSGELIIKLSDLKQGIYIIKANQQSLKVTRK